MPSFETSHMLQAYRGRCEDRIEIISDGDRTLIVVADGAGGTGDGHIAAETVTREARANYEAIGTSSNWSHFLTQLDFRMPNGESTAVVVDVYPDRILGASVGDSCAWIINGPDMMDLTQSQVRKPLLGSRFAQPVPFSHGRLDGILLVGTDGFFNYAKPDTIIKLVARTEFVALPRACIDMVRLPSGEFWDDVAIVACRARRVTTSRKRYAI